MARAKTTTATAMLDAPTSIARRDTASSVVERTRPPCAAAEVAAITSSSTSVDDADHAVAAATVSATIASPIAPWPTTGASTLTAGSPLEEVATSGEQVAGQRGTDRHVVTDHLVAQHGGAVGRGDQPDDVQRAIGTSDRMRPDR